MYVSTEDRMQNNALSDRRPKQKQVCIYIYIYTYTQICVCIHIYIYIYIHTYILMNTIHISIMSSSSSSSSILNKQVKRRAPAMTLDLTNRIPTNTRIHVNTYYTYSIACGNIMFNI